jgi:hypothetical protein
MLTLPRHAQIWLPALARHYARQYGPRQRPRAGAHVMFTMADHFEPFNGGVSQAQANRRVDEWRARYTDMAAGLHDADGRPPQHSFFYPIEQYDERHVEALASLVERGVAEVEVHLHHDRDTSARLRRNLLAFAELLHRRHGLLTQHRGGAIGYGFVHGNWTLDNAHPDGRFCGVNDEISILQETGCYADFTLPAAPDVAQTRTVNSIYYAVDDPDRPKSHDRGIRAAVGRRPPSDGLLMVQGPLSLDWGRRRFGVLPGVESGTIDASPGNWPSGRRFRCWLGASVTVAGRPDWVFIKVHTHGAPESNAAALLGPSMRQFHLAIQREVRALGLHLHYVTAREMANIVRAAEDGASGHPGEYRDYWLPRPVRRRRPVARCARRTDENGVEIRSEPSRIGGPAQAGDAWRGRRSDQEVTAVRVDGLPKFSIPVAGQVRSAIHRRGERRQPRHLQLAAEVEIRDHTDRSRRNSADDCAGRHITCD